MKQMIIIAIAISLVAAAAFAAPVKTDSKIEGTEIGRSDGSSLGVLDCSNAIDIFVGNTYTGDNTGLPDNATTYNCVDWNESGGEVVYFLSLVDQTLKIELFFDEGTCDLDLFALTDCDETTCIAVTEAGQGNYIFADSPITGDFYFVVDGKDGSGCAYDLVVGPWVPPVANFCDVVDQANGGDTFSGTNCNGENLISELGCEVFSENGLEYYYEVFMPAGSSFTADVTSTSDGALWVVDACESPFGCLAYADDTVTGELETISYANDTASDMYVYLVIDSWGTGACGDYDMTFNATGGAVAVEGAAFGAVKALYR